MAQTFYPTPTTTPLLKKAKRSRPNHRQRRRLAQAKIDNKYCKLDQEWPSNINQKNHCNRCHLPYEGDLHWECHIYPALDTKTCPTCNAWSATPDPIDVYPLVVVAAHPLLSPLNSALKKARHFYLHFDYAPPFDRAIFSFLLSFLAFVLARKF